MSAADYRRSRLQKKCSRTLAVPNRLSSPIALRPLSVLRAAPPPRLASRACAQVTAPSAWGGVDHLSMGSLGALPSFGACMASSGKACGYAALGRERGAWRECVTRAYTDKRLAAFVAEPTHWVRPQCPQRRGGRVPERMPAKVRLVCLCVCLFVSGACARLFDRRRASVERIAKGARRRRGTARVPRSAPIVCEPADRTVRCMRCGIRDQEHRI